MITENAAQSEQSEDFYQSRNGSKPKIIPRVDPVVYAQTANPGLIAEDLQARYEQQGFLVIDNVFNEREVDCFKQELKRLNDDEKIKASAEAITELSSDELRSLFKIHEVSPVFKRLAADNRLAGLAQHLLNDRVYIHQSRLNYKPGFRGKEFYWHSDFETWHVEDGMPRMRALSMSIILTENDQHNGPLMLVPGSHKKFVVCEEETPENHYSVSLKKQEYGIPSDECLASLVADGGIVSANGKPGSVLIFDSNVMHGSNSNITPWPRSNLFFVYNAINNRVTWPFCGLLPRPEYLCSRKNIRVIEPRPFIAAADQLIYA
ncbi:ectoine hydroxylase [Methylotuvimicrobium alcaliphilum]|uniref:Ectoine hydroxylase n=2 Tax=Methylotuvimicrobium alcaliphilum TaxID=271065 RepID=G4T4A0_META2|nr:ectoine hydroxylase [Methylotuvimicrobium alcaliphilum]AAY96769.2 putative ectoine hydroxylase [Methylotuvimicrobium alcaliphilum 20Z]CCE24911.1 putative ectoine hydroxylase [Methylotuvimicrobium alcaliphilum 20Z]